MIHPVLSAGKTWNYVEIGIFVINVVIRSNADLQGNFYKPTDIYDL
jgi:hypothetical protein